jgi:hypothetical protein
VAGACFATRFVRRCLNEFAPPRQLRRWASFVIMSMNDALARPRQFFWRRTVILGSSILATSVFIGIAMTFWREYGDSLFKIPAPTAYRLFIQATVGPVFMGIYFLWLITVPVMFVLTMMVYVGSQLRRIWLSIGAFVLMGFYWLWLVKLMADGAFD